MSFVCSLTFVSLTDSLGLVEVSLLGFPVPLDRCDLYVETVALRANGFEEMQLS